MVFPRRLESKMVWGVNKNWGIHISIYTHYRSNQSPVIFHLNFFLMYTCICNVGSQFFSSPSSDSVYTHPYSYGCQYILYQIEFHTLFINVLDSYKEHSQVQYISDFSILIPTSDLKVIHMLKIQPTLFITLGSCLLFSSFLSLRYYELTNLFMYVFECKFIRQLLF